jgi:DNA-binding CsgD family transcriptional regulator/pimeloyl-ACP methyl ester carboxylesterase
MDDLLRDLTELLAYLEPGPVAILGHGATSHVAVNYALSCPERVAALVFLSCSVANSAWPAALWRDLASESWESFVLGSGGVSGSHFEAANRLEMIRQSVTQEDWLIRERAYRDSDLSRVLPRVETPALVLHPRGYLGLPPSESVRLASLLCNGQLTMIDGETPFGDAAQGVAVLERFLSEALPAGRAGRDGERTEQLLSSRQAQVLMLLADGKTNREIAELLTLSERTVQRHVADIYDKIGARNRSEATVYALKHREAAV